MKNFLRLLCFEMRLHSRRLAEWAALILFFLIVILLLPFAIGPDQELLRRLAPGLIWFAVLLMSLLALEKIFITDARDGTLDLMLLSPLPLPMVIFAKLLGQILVMLIALMIMLVPATFMLGLKLAILPVLLLSFLLGMPVLVLLGGIVGAVTISLPRNPALLTLLLIPLYIPVFIFAGAANDAVISGSSPLPHLLLLGAMLALALPTSPFIIAAALRNAEG
jgi:heme exporter protein B